MATKTLTIQLNDEQLPILSTEQDAHLTFSIHADGDELRAAPAGESRPEHGGNPS